MKCRNTPRAVFAALLAIILPLALLCGCGLARQTEPGPSQSAEPAPSSESAQPARQEADAALAPFLLAAATYPEQVRYPEDGDFADRTEIDAWYAAQQMRRQYQGAGAGLESFFTKTIPVFLSGDDGENRLFSPMNLYFALAMLAEVTDGGTRSQILSLLGESGLDSLRARANRLWLVNYCDDGASANVIADSIWLRDDMRYRNETLDRLAGTYRASAFRGEMGSAEYDRALQAWINSQTGGLLQDMAGGLRMDPETVLAIASTLYFRDKWEYEFSESENTEDTFRGAAGDTRAVFMHRTQMYGPYYYGDGFSAASIRLNKEGRMLFLLPDEGVTPEEMLANGETLRFLTTRNKDAEWEKRASVRVIMSVPKFDVSAEQELSDGLRSLGVTDCFDQAAADFSPLAENAENAYLSQVRQGVRVAIDEKGVVAAAYTVMMAAGGAEPPEEEVVFTLDRPFVFVIYNGEELPLFVGIVNQVG